MKPSDFFFAAGCACGSVVFSLASYSASVSGVVGSACTGFVLGLVARSVVGAWFQWRVQRGAGR